jgi:hypothetical protein
MNLQTLLLVIGSVAIVLTLIVGLIMKGHKSWIMTYLQNFCGAFYIFSGWVKAVDPMGMGFKIADYFTAFESLFTGTWFSFLSPLFPFLSQYQIGISMFVIIFEIVLGIMLLMGHRPKALSWMFFILLLFFTGLTGFTYLTGYVPPDVNFFQFGQWVEFKESNQQVTDCGCFGDFIKLKPKISFFKDLALMIPALFFLFKHKTMHQLFSKRIRDLIVAVCTIGLFIYCLSNFVWDIPHADFRPFKKNTDVRAQKAIELQALADVDIIGWEFTNSKTGEIASIMNPDYMAIYKSYPKEDGWVVDQIKSEPTLVPSKISEFEIVDTDGYDKTEEILNDPNYAVMIVSYKLKGVGSEQVQGTLLDTIMKLDTLDTKDANGNFIVEETIADIQKKNYTYTDYKWDESFANDYSTIIKPFTEKARADGYKTYAVVGGSGAEQLEDLKKELGLGLDMYTADDILLKTIVRSNPGIVLWKDGQIVSKWHKKKLPSYEEVKQEFMK